MKLHLELIRVDGRYALALLPAASPPPAWARGRFFAVISTNDAVTVICDEDAVPAGVTAQGGFRCLRIAGEFALASVGVVAAVAEPLANAGISVFVHSTWQTDYLFVQDGELSAAEYALVSAGHKMREDRVV